MGAGIDRVEWKEAATHRLGYWALSSARGARALSHLPLVFYRRSFPLSDPWQLLVAHANALSASGS